MSFPVHETSFARAVRIELDKARLYFPATHSLHEGYGIILEEVEEFWAEVKRKPSERNEADLLKELIQIAAMCQRTAEDLGLI